MAALRDIRQQFESRDLEGVRKSIQQAFEGVVNEKRLFDKGVDQAVLLRVGVHYISRCLGTWVRAAKANNVNRDDGSPYHIPFGGFPNAEVLERHWDRLYDQVPSEINWFVDEKFRPSVIVFGDDQTYQDEELLSLSLDTLRELRSYFNSWPGFVEVRVPQESVESEGWPPTVKEAAFIVAQWLSRRRRANNIDDKVNKGADIGELELQSALYGLLYTWSPTITDQSDRLLRGSAVWVAHMESFPRRNDSGEKIATLGTLFEVKKGNDYTAVGPRAGKVFEAFDGTLDCILSAEIEALSQRGVGRSVAVEKVIRQVRFATPERVLSADKWSEWRRVFPLSGNDDDVARVDLWRAPLWGASRRFSDLCESVRKAIDQGERQTEKGPGVHCVFFWSEPGTGKEGLSDLCHLLADRSSNRARLAKNQSRFSDLLETDLKPGRKTSAWEDLLQRLGQSKSKFPQGKKCGDGKSRWLFNKFTINCAYLSRLGAERELFGSQKDDFVRLGLLSEASWVTGTIFFDEFNTLNPGDASLFLRFTEKPYSVPHPQTGIEIPLDLFCIFASNKSPEQLIKEGWNPAVFSRIAKPGRVFEIPPLAERREDIAIAVARRLWDEFRDLTILDAAGLRLLCELTWPGNYRQLLGFISVLVQHRKERRTSKVIGFEEVVDALIEVGMSLGGE